MNDIKRRNIEVCDERIRQLETLEVLRKEISNILRNSVKSGDNFIDDFKSVNQDIFKFSESLNQEVMRLMMIPEKNISDLPKCEECDVTSELLKKLESSKLCKDLAVGNEESCMNEVELLHHLLKVTDIVDETVKDIFSETTFNVGKYKRVYWLQDMKILKNNIEEIVHKLLYSGVGSLGLRSINISHGMKAITKNMRKLNAKCLRKCGKPCNECGALVIEEAKTQLKEYEDLVRLGNYVDVKEVLKDNLLSNIEKITNDMKNYQKSKVLNLTSECEGEKYTMDVNIR